MITEGHTMEEERPTPSAWAIGSDIASLSVEELHEIADTLRAEADRLEAAAQTKQNEINAADALFRK